LQKGQGTSRRLREKFEVELKRGLQVELHRLSFGDFQINNAWFVPQSSLQQDFIRKMLENFLIADFLANNDFAGCEVLNAPNNPIERRRRRAIKRNRAAGLPELTNPRQF